MKSINQIPFSNIYYIPVLVGFLTSWLVMPDGLPSLFVFLIGGSLSGACVGFYSLQVSGLKTNSFWGFEFWHSLAVLALAVGLFPVIYLVGVLIVGRQ